MPSTQLNIRLGSDNSIYNHDVPAKVKRSKFNYSRKRNFALDAGAIVPIDLFETVPGDSIQISINYLLKTMPLVVAPFTNYKVRTHWYYCRLVDLWKGASTFITKGRSGSISLSIPKIKPNDWAFKINDEVGEGHDTTSIYFTPCSLSSYLGIKSFASFDPEAMNTNSYGKQPFYPVFDSSFADDPENNFPKDGVSALPFFMYQKIYRMAYTVPNLLQDNKVWFPDDVGDCWRISYDKSNLVTPRSTRAPSNIIFTPNSTFDSVNKDPTSHISPSVSDDCVNILALRYALFSDDRFTTALPWSQRGTAPTVDLGEITIPSTDVDLTSRLDVGMSPDSENFIVLKATLGKTSDDEAYGLDHMFSSGGTDQITSDAFARGNLFLDGGFPSRLSFQPIQTDTKTNAGSTHSKTVNSGEFSLNQFRELVALSVWQERNARTQGDYNATIFAHFNTNPKQDDFEPVYIGGTSDIINFSDVVQTSQTSTTPQGTQTGLGSSLASGDVGFFYAPDYGYVMGLMIIQPETIYSQGIEKLWTREVMEDFFMPEYEGLGLEEILNQEIFCSGNSDDTQLFGYQERNTEYKSRMNEDIGFFALQSDKMFSAMSQSRVFSSKPSLSHQFLVMSPENMRRDFSAVPSYPIFKCSLASEIRIVRPMSYKNIPNTFGF